MGAARYAYDPYSRTDGGSMRPPQPAPTRPPTYEAAIGTATGVGGGVEAATAAAIQDVLDRLELELKVIEKTGSVSYFLIVGDFVRYGREHGIACVARGSAAGSIETYLLEISNVDPIH